MSTRHGIQMKNPPHERVRWLWMLFGPLDVTVLLVLLLNFTLPSVFAGRVANSKGLLNDLLVRGGQLQFFQMLWCLCLCRRVLTCWPPRRTPAAASAAAVTAGPGVLLGRPTGRLVVSSAAAAPASRCLQLASISRRRPFLPVSE